MTLSRVWKSARPRICLGSEAERETGDTELEKGPKDCCPGAHQALGSSCTVS